MGSKILRGGGGYGRNGCEVDSAIFSKLPLGIIIRQCKHL